MALISPDHIRAQLQRLLDSPEFTAAERLGLFLRYVVEQTLNGQREGIKQYTIAVDALGYGADFDPQTDSIIRIQARRLRRALEQYYQGRGTEDPIRIAIPKGSYVPVFLANPRPPGASGAPEQPAPVSAKTPEFTTPTIAVVQFENLNEKDEHAFLARGLTGEIIISLSRFAGLSVLGPLDQAADKPINVHQIKHEYGAQFILQGRVRSLMERIRITVDLTDAATSGNLWGRTFEFDLGKTSLFDIEDTVTGQVAAIIADGVGIIFKQLRSETYAEHLKLNDVTQAVLKYNHAWAIHHPENWRAAILALGTALEKQPENRPACDAELPRLIKLLLDEGHWTAADARAWWDRHRDAPWSKGRTASAPATIPVDYAGR